jgi:hypothetical protein
MFRPGIDHRITLQEQREARIVYAVRSFFGNTSVNNVIRSSKEPNVVSICHDVIGLYEIIYGNTTKGAIKDEALASLSVLDSVLRLPESAQYSLVAEFEIRKAIEEIRKQSTVTSGPVGSRRDDGSDDDYTTEPMKRVIPNSPIPEVVPLIDTESELEREVQMELQSGYSADPLLDLSHSTMEVASSATATAPGEITASSMMMTQLPSEVSQIAF